MENPAVTREKLVSDLRIVIGDAEELLKATAQNAGETVAAARAKVQASMNGAKKRLADVSDATLDSAKVAARATDEFVREHPWQAVGIGAAVGVILGMLISRR
jgi:ElaB/YqjD/DUF883 family membrane-anchored ribosome-binding protein